MKLLADVANLGLCFILQAFLLSPRLNVYRLSFVATHLFVSGTRSTRVDEREEQQCDKDETDAGRQGERTGYSSPTSQYLFLGDVLSTCRYRAWKHRWKHRFTDLETEIRSIYNKNIPWSNLIATMI